MTTEGSIFTDAEVCGLSIKDAVFKAAALAAFAKRRSALVLCPEDWQFLADMLASERYPFQFIPSGDANQTLMALRAHILTFARGHEVRVYAKDGLERRKIYWLYQEQPR